MAFISKEDFTTHIYEENIDKISGDDDLKLDEAINTAIQKAKRSLSRYDVQAIFTSVAPEKAKYSELITYIKDIAKYHFIAVCNVSVDYDVAEKRYKSAIEELKGFKSGELVDGWPVPEVPSNNSNFRGGSNERIDPYY